MKLFWLSFSVLCCVTATLAAKKSPSPVKSVKREISSSYHGPSHKYLPPSAAVASSYSSYNRGHDFGGSAGVGSYHGSKGSSAVFNLRGSHSHAHGSFESSVPKVETYLVHMEHAGGGAGGGSGSGSGYRYTVGPSYSSAGSTHPVAAHFGGSASDGAGVGGHRGSGSHGFKVHSVVIPVHGLGDGGGGYHYSSGASHNQASSDSGHHDFGGGGGNGGHSGHSAGGNSYPSYHYSSTGSGSDYDYDHYDHSLSGGHSVGSANTAGSHSFGHVHANHGSAGSSGYSYAAPSAVAFGHSNHYAAATESPAYALGQKGLGHYTYTTGSKPYHRHTDIFAPSPFQSAKIAMPFQASAFLGASHDLSSAQHASGFSGDHYHDHSQSSADEFAAPAVHYLPAASGGPADGEYTSGSHAVTTQEAGLSAAYLPPSNAYGAPVH